MIMRRMMWKSPKDEGIMVGSKDKSMMEGM